MHGSHDHSHNFSANAGQYEKLVKTCTIFATSVAGIMVLMKIYAWYITGSVTMLSSLMDSSMDFVVSGINFFAARYSFKPADNDHRFGHSRAQDLAALAQASFIAYLSVVITIEAIKKFIHPMPIEDSMEGLIVIIIALVLTILLLAYQRYVYNKTKSTMVHADAAHYLTDVLSNISVIIVLLVSQRFDVPWLDPTLGLVLAGYVLWSGVKVGKTAFNNLMDKEIEENRDEIMAIINSHNKVVAISELKTRRSGNKLFIQFDFTMDGGATLNEAHEVAHELEALLHKNFPEAEIFIHQEPA